MSAETAAPYPGVTDVDQLGDAAFGMGRPNRAHGVQVRRRQHPALDQLSRTEGQPKAEDPARNHRVAVHLAQPATDHALEIVPGRTAQTPGDELQNAGLAAQVVRDQRGQPDAEVDVPVERPGWLDRPGARHPEPVHAQRPRERRGRHRPDGVLVEHRQNL
jgi:hypothetical protein